jgi:hypothetical protein
MHGRAQNRGGQRGAVSVDQDGAGVAGVEQVDGRLQQAGPEISFALQEQVKACRQQVPERSLRSGRRVDGIGRSLAIQRQAVDRGCKIADEAGRQPAAFLASGRSGGDRRVLERPAAGVLQKIPIATDRILVALCLAVG